MTPSGTARRSAVTVAVLANPTRRPGPAPRRCCRVVLDRARTRRAPVRAAAAPVPARRLRPAGRGRRRRRRAGRGRRRRHRPPGAAGGRRHRRAVRRRAGRHRQRLRRRSRRARPTRSRRPTLIAAALRAGRTRPVDLARMTGAGGADALVRGGARGRLRRDRQRAGQPDALAARPAPLRPGDPGRAGPAAPAALHADASTGCTHELDAVLVAVGNSASYGGGMRICPAADPTDGLLDVVVAARSTGRPCSGSSPASTGAPTSTTRWSHLPGARPSRSQAEGITGVRRRRAVCPLPITVTCVPGALRLLR